MNKLAVACGLLLMASSFTTGLYIFGNVIRHGGECLFYEHNRVILYGEFGVNMVLALLGAILFFSEILKEVK